MEAFGLGLLAIGRLLGIEDQRHILIAAPYLAQQFQTGLGVALLHMGEPSGRDVHGETGIGDDAEGVLMILLVDLHRLLVVGGEHHLRTATLSLGGGVGVQRLGRETLRLREDIVIQIR